MCLQSPRAQRRCLIAPNLLRLPTALVGWTQSLASGHLSRSLSMKKLSSAVIVALGLLTVPPAHGQEASRPYAEARDYAKWEKEVAAYEAADRQNPPPKGGILFIGSSTIRLWKTLAEDYPDHKVI